MEAGLKPGSLPHARHESELFVLDEREKPIGTVPDPLKHHRLITLRGSCLDERRALTEHGDGKLVPLEQVSVRIPRRRHGLLGIVEKVDIPRNPRCGDELVERGATGEICLATSDSVLR